MGDNLELEEIQAQKYCVGEIATLFDLCTLRDELDALIADTEDVCVLELAVRIKLYRAVGAKTKPQLLKPLKRLLSTITLDNCEKICGILSAVLLVEPSDANFRCFLGHLRANSKEVLLTMKLLEVGLDRCSVNLFTEIIDEAFLVELYSKADCGEELKTVRRNVLVKYVNLGGACNEITGAVLRNDDAQALLCLGDALTPTGHHHHDELWNFLQGKLLSDAYGDRKLALHVLKGCVAHDSKTWNDFFNLFEILDDNQLHLITPSLILLDGIAGIHPRWLVCVYKSMLTHALNPVVFHGLTHLLRHGYRTEAPFFRAVVKYVPVAFNKVENSEGYRESLVALEVFICSSYDELFFILMRESLSVPWVPTAAWYFYSTLLNSTAGPASLPLFADLIRKLESLPHKFIREGCLTLAVNLLCNGLDVEDFSFEDFLKCAALTFEYDKHFGDVLDNFLLGTDEILQRWKEEDTVHDELEKWRRDKVFVSAGKIRVLMKLFDGDDAVLRKLFLLAKDEGVPSQTRDYVALHLSKSYLGRADVLDYLSQRVDDVKADDEFHLLTEIVFDNVTQNEADTRLVRKCERITSSPTSFKSHQVLLAATIATSSGRLSALKSVEAIFMETEVVCFCDFFVLKYCICGDAPRDKEVFECLLNTRGDDVALIVFKHLPDVIRCFGTDEEVTKFLGLCYGKLIGLKNPSALRQYLACRFDPGEAGHLLKEHEPFASVLAEVLEVKSREGTDLEPFVPLLVELLLYGDVYTKYRRIEYDVCLEIQLLSRKHPSENPALEETLVRSRAIATLLNVLRGDRRERAADAVVSVLLEKYAAHFNKRYFADSLIHLLKLRTLQALLLVHAYLSSDRVASLIEFITNSFCNESHQPSVKHLLQWLMIRLLSSSRRDDDFIDEIAEKIRRTDHTRPSTLTAFVPVLLHVCKGKPEETIERLFRTLLPWTMGPQFKLRLYSQIAIKKLADFSRVASHRSVLDKYGAVIDGVRSTLKESGEKEIRNVLRGDRWFLEVFEPEGHFTLETVYVEIPRLDGVTSTEWEFLSLQELPEGDYLKIRNKDESLKKCAFETREQPVEGDGGGACANVQKKIVPWGQEMRRCKSDLILVCSLVESPANLGGLSRTCEVYGVKQMVIRDAKAVNNKDFKSLSMSSENWVDIVEVKPDGLGDYLMGAKRRGYVVIGAEQTSQSVSLNGFRFPFKSLVVLGNEREGVPPSIIPLLDVCLEIPQFGFVRSLNVHVAGAVLIWEYVKRHLVK